MGWRELCPFSDRVPSKNHANNESIDRNLVEYASAHEHRLYINLLNKMKAFIAK